MGIPTKVLITLAIIAGIGLGTGMVVLGLLVMDNYRDDQAFFAAAGGGLLTASISALAAHLAGGFRDLDDHGP